MNVTSFVARLNAIVNKMESLKIVMDDASIVGKAVQCLPPQFDNFRESWRLSAPRFAKLTDLTSQLLACESDQVSRSMQTQISTGEALVGRKVGRQERDRLQASCVRLCIHRSVTPLPLVLVDCRLVHQPRNRCLNR
ncbi:hypothetical protein M513_07784 [Trichuris suis]|uniref:Uncharacterized protein n=1 Tax=Trichuris suis TaxID=68888 RepID=A0A085M2D3_9BILA|nr:hypothetical protein M513_07784 [Trichuris suis]